MREQTHLLAVLGKNAGRTPEAKALIFPDRDRAVTYGELWLQTQSFAEQFQALGKSGDVLALLADRSPTFLPALLGAWQAGMTVAILGTDWKSAEIEAAVELSRPAFLVGAETSLANLENPASFRDHGVQLRSAEQIALGPKPGGPRRPLPEASAPAQIMFTSGTTGRPKGVVQTHGAISHSLAAATQRFDFEPGAVMLSFLPHHHTHGLLMTLLLPLLYGGVALVDRQFDAFGAARFWELVAQYRVHHFSSVPAILEVLRQMHPRVSGIKTDSLRFAFSASSPLSAELRSWWQTEASCPLANNYGLTEATSWVSYGELSAAAPAESIGRPLYCRIQIVDETGVSLPQGETGEMVVSGPQLMTGYYRDEEKTRMSLCEGRLHTGDLGHFGPDGRLYLNGRNEDKIDVGGIKVDPAEVEEPARQVPGIIEAAAFPYPDPHYGEVVALAIVAADPPPSLPVLRAELGKLLSPHKLPRRLFLAARLPTTEMGKIQRRQLAALAKENKLKEI